MGVIIRATTAPGIEDVAQDEGSALLAREGFPAVDAGESGACLRLPGVVVWELEPGVTVDEVRRGDPLRSARSLFHVAVHVAEVAWDGRTLASLLRGVERTELAELHDAESFRVSCSRVGEHDFQSPEVERETGSIVRARYGTAVDLEAYAVHVKVDIVGPRAFCGYQLTRRKGLDRRYRWVYHPRVTLRTPIAYAMLVIAGYASRPDALHDPFCGSGTILLESAAIAAHGGAGMPALSGSDWDTRAVEGTRANLSAAGVAGVRVSRIDARELAATVRERSLAYIVTNPPFGIRLAKGLSLFSLYDSLLGSAAKVLRPGGTLALLVGRQRGTFNRALRAYPEFGREHVRVVEMGGVYAALYVLRLGAIDGAPSAE